MKTLRYRKPSLNTVLGVTKAKRRIKKELGIYDVTKYINYIPNTKRRLKRNIGYYSTPMKVVRNGFPTPYGIKNPFLLLIIAVVSLIGLILKGIYKLIWRD